MGILKFWWKHKEISTFATKNEKKEGRHVQQKNGHVQEKYVFFHNVYDNEIATLTTQKL